ncbi:MAG: hypothetical protein A3A98_01250 [Candidatus Staskawiczbacteria bacterium RIFCSPLOWO2_01_FULL_40_39]|uniref:Prepilin-type N-terminal cleavage/methylation domain-containing protein n=1 Tax=Candidatus Staskawiczbacteria bacterium RIFCSPHIGHO2_01_FULL_39_25 TaxID=1802202 RepID=A0A1G2HN33_9BACT|nr:MAG: hypothetical protein A2730_01250 [Candidatus Staskawiczbacteria bacterium RIFCSPHIGHO2_01_FULL_39_25]OGZ73354.1 MAG: hypothetical protein A3A98_01250 [Candidatus Staskawiczbacteria bacterium RIFCSPLOWO2_01_FULL_40_39]OGZ76879.1 MAG: hypothetical protein A3I87_00500 [Candidatus Staskawiczbacteria bacterium RIFCSPLOWO2_02_FULL_39_8]
MKQGGFTLIEVLVVVAIIMVLSTIFVTDFGVIQKKSDLDAGVQEVAGILKLAQSKTLASENNNQYGVYLNTAASPHQYILFKGSSYAARDTSYDQQYPLPKTIEFFAIDLNGGNEVVFDKITGASQQSGSIPFRVQLDTTQTKTIYVASSGTVGFEAPVAPSDASRVKDSRHVHFDYSRIILTAAENIVLDFNNGQVVQTLPISSHLANGQIDLETTANAGGSDQTVQIHTHRLNNLDTQFSIHRDRRFNDVPLKITLSGDISGYLVNYSADGLTTDFSSLFTSNLNWQ